MVTDEEVEESLRMAKESELSLRYQEGVIDGTKEGEQRTINRIQKYIDFLTQEYASWKEKGLARKFQHQIKKAHHYEQLIKYLRGEQVNES